MAQSKDTGLDAGVPTDYVENDVPHWDDPITDVIEDLSPSPHLFGSAKAAPPEVTEEVDRVISPKDRRMVRKVLSPVTPRPMSAGVDSVVLPKHYARFQIEPIHFIGENKLNFFQGNIVKYILRYDAKNGIEDVRKAGRYCRMFERFLLGDPDWHGPDPQAASVQEIIAEVRKVIMETLSPHNPARATLLLKLDEMQVSDGRTK